MILTPRHPWSRDFPPPYMSRDMTIPTKCVCDQHGSRPVCTSAQSDQDPCCSLSVSLLVIGFVSEQHGSWADCADVHPNWAMCRTHLTLMTKMFTSTRQCAEPMQLPCRFKATFKGQKHFKTILFLLFECYIPWGIFLELCLNDIHLNTRLYAKPMLLLCRHKVTIEHHNLNILCLHNRFKWLFKNFTSIFSFRNHDKL
jgi:hypothetical protein